jgi:hypothetical protein
MPFNGKREQGMRISDNWKKNILHRYTYPTLRKAGRSGYKNICIYEKTILFIDVKIDIKKPGFSSPLIKG